MAKTQERSSTSPKSTGFERILYRLYGRQIEPAGDVLGNYTEIYQGLHCRHNVGGNDSTFPITANTTYEFAVSASNEVGVSLKSAAFKVSSANLARRA